MGFLAYFWYISRNSQKYLIIALVFTVIYLYLVPLVVRVPVWISESYYPFGESELINSYGHLVTTDFAREVLNVERSLPILSYHSWPLFLYLASSFTLITGLPPSIVLKFFPFLTISLYGVLTFLILRGKMKVSYAIMGAAWFLACFFTRQYYFGPQAIAYIFFLLIIFLMSQLSVEKQKKRKSLIVIFFLLFFAITLTHALTSLMMLIVIFALYLTQRLYYNSSFSIMSRGIFIFSALILVAYNVFVARVFIDRTLQTLSQVISKFWEPTLFRETSRIVGSEAQRLNYSVSWSLVLIVGFIAGLQVLFVLNKFRSRKQRKNKEFTFFSVVWLILVFIFAVTAVYGSHEAYQRAFMFGLIPLTYLCISLLSRKPRLLVLILGGLLFLSFMVQYGADSYRAAPDSVLAGTEFFVNNSPNNASLLYNFYPHVRYFDSMKHVRFVYFPSSLPFTEYPNSSQVNSAIMRAEYISRSSLQHNYYVYFFGYDILDDFDYNTLNRIYDNGDYQLYTHPNRTRHP